MVGKAINSPVGIFTEALITRFGSYKLEAAAGIPDSQIRNCVNKVVEGRGNAFLLGRVILASRLQYFFAIDPDWAEGGLLARMDWEAYEDAYALWQGYLWVPRVSADLALALKKQLLQSMTRSEELHDKAGRLHQIFVLVCLNYPNLFTAAQQHKALVSIGAAGLQNIATFLARTLRGEEVDADTYWEEKLRPFIRRAWPKEVELISSKSSENLALMVVELNNSFTEAVELVIPIVRSCTDLARLTRRLVETHLPETFPSQVLALLSAVIGRDYQRPVDSIRTVVNRILVAQPNLEDDPRYRLLEDFLLERE